MYKDFKGIPPHIAQQRIELDTTIPLTHQARYRMNLNYIVIVKQDLDKLLVVKFIVPIENASWLSLIVMVLKKNKTCHVDFQKLNVATKKNLYTLPFIEEVLNMVTPHEIYYFFNGFFVIVKLK
jgi:hypothetical protein